MGLNPIGHNALQSKSIAISIILRVFRHGDQPLVKIPLATSLRQASAGTAKPMPNELQKLPRKTLRQSKACLEVF